MSNDPLLRDALIGADGTADPVIPIRPDQIFSDPTAATPVISTPSVTVPVGGPGFSPSPVGIGEEALIEAERQLEAVRELSRQATERERQDRNRAESQQRTARRAAAGGYAVPSTTGGAFIRPPVAGRAQNLSQLPPPAGPSAAARSAYSPTAYLPPTAASAPPSAPAAPWRQSGQPTEKVQQLLQQWSTQASSRIAAQRATGSRPTSSRKKSGNAVGCLVVIIMLFVIFGQAGGAIIEAIKSVFEGH